MNCNCKLENFFYVALDYQGRLVIITDNVAYPNVEVDPNDLQITFKQSNVRDFIKPNDYLKYNGIHKITW